MLHEGGSSELSRLLREAEREHARGQPVAERFKRETHLVAELAALLSVLAGELERAATASLPGGTPEGELHGGDAATARSSGDGSPPN